MYKIHFAQPYRAPIPVIAIVVKPNPISSYCCISSLIRVVGDSKLPPGLFEVWGRSWGVPCPVSCVQLFSSNHPCNIKATASYTHNGFTLGRCSQSCHWGRTKFKQCCYWFHANPTCECPGVKLGCCIMGWCSLALMPCILNWHSTTPLLDLLYLAQVLLWQYMH